MVRVSRLASDRLSAHGRTQELGGTYSAAGIECIVFLTLSLMKSMVLVTVRDPRVFLCMRLTGDGRRQSLRLWCGGKWVST